jgi:hypothetical protein
MPSRSPAALTGVVPESANRCTRGREHDKTSRYRDHVMVEKTWIHPVVVPTEFRWQCKCQERQGHSDDRTIASPSRRIRGINHHAAFLQPEQQAEF